jgi:HSP20 family protein
METTKNSLFNALLDDLLSIHYIIDNTTTNDNVKAPVHDVIENKDEYIIEMLLAGVKKDDVSIDTEKNKLIIKAERKEKSDVKYNRNQSYKGKYERIFTLPDNVDIENINANMEDGILIVKIPKIEINKKKIEIK